MRAVHGRAFTLMELLVAVGVIALLLGVLLPGLSRAREQARATVCGSNVRQLALANGLYAQDSVGAFVPGAADFLRNLHRWHGVRASVAEPFAADRGPLIDYLGGDRAVRACPSFSPEARGFEAGCGGYGYNNAYIGVQTVANAQGKAIVVSDQAGARMHHVKRPAETLMFADTAFVDGRLIEYSFAEPRFHPEFASRADPSIHFRHARRANIAWCDGHVVSETFTFTWSSGFYEGDPSLSAVGWFGQSDDNSLFDLQ